MSNLQDFANVGNAVSGLCAAAGLLAIFIQLRKQRKLAAAEFVLRFNDAFERHNPVYKKLVQFDADPTVLTTDDLAAIVQYLTFFETMYTLVRDGAVSMSLIDDLFGYRFFLATHNSFIQECELIKDREYYKNLYRFHLMWVGYRRRLGSYIHNEKTSLEKVDGYHVLSRDNSRQRAKY